MNRIPAAFQRLREGKRKAFMPFLSAGDPSLDATAAVLSELQARRAADLVELGLPYSDPVADGPTIQASYTRALSAGARPGAILQRLARLRADGFDLPVCLMTSYSLVYRPGVEEFVARAADSGVDGLIVPDLPLDEAGPLGDVLARRDLAHVLLVAPTTPPDRLRRILQHSTGFVYCVSVTGITGQRETMPKHLADYVRRVKKGAKVPVCVGFGISQPEHVAAVAKVADGVIVGSAVVHTIADHAADPPEAIARAVADLCDRLAAPLR